MLCYVSLSSTSIGNAGYPKRSGRRMVPHLTRDLSSRAPDRRSWFVSHAHNTRFDAHYEARQCLLYWIARAHTSHPRELAHISLTALARSAQCTGFYAWLLDALLRGGAMAILTVMLARSTISWYVTHAHVGYTQNLNSVA